MENGFIPEVGEVVIIDGEKYVFFDTNQNIPAHENGENFFKVAYYFISKMAIDTNNMIDMDEIKNVKTVYKKRHEMFSPEQKTGEKYEITEKRILVFE